ncbi:hypothetical protein AK88_05603 [Plasmodium fragile]|uniref:Uncharacterized protein n=1 Tax=Plasmodium fragile TaxID=5857 RepID=A0A0D9QGC9_PLAFR|nr:uncharacterized protein AK88_05603 [Plasmodium fragile]KJP84766.1 hypothetical protein AK88_05603 [Plasmodium fragile]
MSHSTDVPLTLYTRVEIEKPLRTPNQNYYVSKPHNPHMPRVGNSHRGRFPSYYVENEHYNNGESSHRMESKIAQNPKPEVVKTEKVDHSANKLGTTNNMLSFFQAVMIIVLLMRLGRNTSERLRKKHEARKKLLKFLAIENRKIELEDNWMADKWKKLERTIEWEKKKMEEKWKNERAKVKAELAEVTWKNPMPGIGPYYDKNKMHVDQKMHRLNMNYEKDKYKKKRRWCSMKAAYYKELKNILHNQETRKKRKCKQMFLFERKWNFGPSTIDEYLEQKQKDYHTANLYYKQSQLLGKKAEEEKAAAEAKAAEEAKEKEAAKKKEKEEEDDEEYEYYDDEHYDDEHYDDEHYDHYEDYEDDVDYYMNPDDEY